MPLSLSLTKATHAKPLIPSADASSSRPLFVAPTKQALFSTVRVSKPLEQPQVFNMLIPQAVPATTMLLTTSLLVLALPATVSAGPAMYAVCQAACAVNPIVYAACQAACAALLAVPGP